MEDVHVVNAEEHEQIIKELTQTPEDGSMQLINKDLKMVDPFSPSLTLEQKEAILEECKANPMYFYDKVLGIKASRMTWDMIRTLQTYPKEELGYIDVEHVIKPRGDHDGDWLKDGFVCEPGIATAQRRMGDFHREEIRDAVSPAFPTSQNGMMREARFCWNMTCMHFVHVLAPSFETISKQFDNVTRERLPEGLSIRLVEHSKWPSEPHFEYRKHNGDWLTLNYTPSVKVPTSGFYSIQEVADMADNAVKLWKKSQDTMSAHATDDQRVYEFGQHVSEAYGREMIRAVLTRGAVSFEYHDRDGQWKTL
jgi:hypothetical protein